MSTGVFRRRMEYLVRHRFPVLTLDEALLCMRRGNLPASATVVTFDDGFYSTFKLAVPVVRQLMLPATIYVTSYYCVKGNPIFRLVVQYMFWKTANQELDLIGLGFDSNSKTDLSNATAKNELMWTIINHAETKMQEDQRVQLMLELGRRLNVDYNSIVETRILTLMTMHEIAEAAKAGIDIQLHTHRHHLPLEREPLQKEIHQNRDSLEPIVGHPLKHLCYPSGIYAKPHLDLLAEVGISSATTCDPGFNYANTHQLLLGRFLDGNNISWIEFEAEMWGFAELLRLLRSKFTAGHPMFVQSDTTTDR